MTAVDAERRNELAGLLFLLFDVERVPYAEATAIIEHIEGWTS